MVYIKIAQVRDGFRAEAAGRLVGTFPTRFEAALRALKVLMSSGDTDVILIKTVATLAEQQEGNDDVCARTVPPPIGKRKRPLPRSYGEQTAPSQLHERSRDRIQWAYSLEQAGRILGPTATPSQLEETASGICAWADTHELSPQQISCDLLEALFTPQ